MRERSPRICDTLEDWESHPRPAFLIHNVPIHPGPGKKAKRHVDERSDLGTVMRFSNRRKETGRWTIPAAVRASRWFVSPPRRSRSFRDHPMVAGQDPAVFEKDSGILGIIQRELGRA